VQRVREIIHQGANKYLLNVNVGLRAHAKKSVTQVKGAENVFAASSHIDTHTHTHAKLLLLLDIDMPPVQKVCRVGCCVLLSPVQLFKGTHGEGRQKQTKKSASVCLQALWQINLHIAFQLLHLNVKLQKRNGNKEMLERVAGEWKTAVL
jgi:hypothetical protein